MTSKELLSGYPRHLLFGFVHYFFSFVGQTFFISLFVAGITAERGWTTETFALIYSAVTLVAAFILPLVGTQLDRLMVRQVSSTAALVMILGCLLLAYTHNWWWLGVGILFVRLGGQGVLTLTGSTTIGRYFTAGRGRALSLSMLGICTAEIMVPPLATLLILQHGYRSVWLLVALLLLFVFLPLIWLLVSKQDSFQRAVSVADQPTNAEVISWKRGQVIRDRRFQLLMPILLFIPFFFTGFVFNQTDIGSLRGYTPVLMAWGLSTFGFTRAICLLFAGGLVDRLGAAKLLPVVLLPATLGVSIFLLAEGGWVVPFTFGLLAVSAGVLTVTAPALWAERYGPQFLGSIKSTVKLLEVLSSAAAPILFSWGLVALGLNVWLALMLAYALCCVGLAIWESRLPPQ